MNIRPINIEKEKAAYEALCEKQKASVFNSLAWLAMYGSRIRMYGLYNNNDELCGSFFMYSTSNKGFKLTICPPYTPHNGLFFENRAANSANIQTTSKHVLETVAQFLKAMKPQLLVFTLPASISDSQPFTWQKFTVKVKYTYHIDLNLPSDTLLANLSSEKRKSLNKAQKDGLDIRREYDMKVVKELILRTFSRKELGKNLAYLDKILFTFATPQNSIAFVAYDKERKPLAATFCVHDTTAAYYLFGGYNEVHRHHGAGVACMWSSILAAKELGLKTFDFEGSMLPEIERYFREFGGTLTPYYTAYKTSAVMSLILKMREVNL